MRFWRDELCSAAGQSEADRTQVVMFLADLFTPPAKLLLIFNLFAPARVQKPYFCGMPYLLASSDGKFGIYFVPLGVAIWR